MLKRSCGLAVKALDYYTTYHWSKVDNSFWQQQPLLLLSLRKTSLRCFQHYRKLFCHPTEKKTGNSCVEVKHMQQYLRYLSQLSVSHLFLWFVIYFLLIPFRSFSFALPLIISAFHISPCSLLFFSHFTVGFNNYNQKRL